jgi:hypothetical protein
MTIREVETVTGFVHGGTDSVENGGDILLIRDVAERRCRVRAVAAFSILGDSPGLSGIGNDRALGALHSSKAASEAGAARRPKERLS